MSPLAQGRELKLMLARLMQEVAASPLAQGRELKHFALKGALDAYEVAPRTGA